MAIRRNEKRRFWEQTIGVEESKIKMRTYRCPECDEILFSVPYDLPIPEENVIVECKNGDKARVPKYDESQKIWTTEREE